VCKPVTALQLVNNEVGVIKYNTILKLEASRLRAVQASAFKIRTCIPKIRRYTWIYHTFGKDKIKYHYLINQRSFGFDSLNSDEVLQKNLSNGELFTSRTFPAKIWVPCDQAKFCACFNRRKISLLRIAATRCPDGKDWTIQFDLWVRSICFVLWQDTKLSQGLCIHPQY